MHTERTGQDKKAQKEGERQGLTVWARMKEKTAKTLAIAGLASVVVGTACVFSSEGLKPVDDAGTTTTDSSTQTGGHDAGSGGHDAGAGGYDAGHDAGVGGDAGYDSGVGGDGGHDSGAGGDAGSTGCPGVTTGTYHGYIPKNSSHDVAGYAIKYKGETVPGSFIAIVDIACNANGTPITTLNCPEGVATPMPTLTAEGKQITITPYDVGAATLGTDVSVQNP